MRSTEYPALRFFPKFFIVLNLYANLFLAGAVLAGVALAVALAWLPAGPWRILGAVLAGLLAAGGLFEYGLITTRLPAKWKYYRVNYKRLRKNGFRADFFLDEMYEPCMRLLIRDLLRVAGHGGRWPELVAEWRGNGAKSFEEMMKRRILADLEKQTPEP
jgi:hypothetical protein